MKNRIYGLIIPLCLSSTLSQKAYSQSYEFEEKAMGVSSTSVTKGSSEKSEDLKLQIKAGLENFKSTSFSRTGYIQTTSLQAEIQRDLRLTGELPVVNGTKNNKNVSEMGNLKLSGAYLGLVSGSWSAVPAMQVAFKNNNAQLSNRHDTYSPSIQTSYRKRLLSFESQLRYDFRKNEQDPNVDIGDMQALELAFEYRVLKPLKARISTNILRSEGVRTKDFIIARESWMNFIQPSMRYDLGQQFWLQVKSNLPVWRSRSLQETEVAFWNPDVPSSDSVTWRTELGVEF